MDYAANNKKVMGYGSFCKTTDNMPNCDEVKCGDLCREKFPPPIYGYLATGICDPEDPNACICFHPC